MKNPLFEILIIVLSIIILILVINIIGSNVNDNIKENKLNIAVALPMLRVKKVEFNPNTNLCDLTLEDDEKKQLWIMKPTKENCYYTVNDLIK